MNRKDFFLAVFSGVLLVLIFPHWDRESIAWVSLIPLLFAIDGKTPYKGLLLGCFAGFIFSLGLVYWVVVVMTTYGKLPFVVALAVLVLFCCYLCVFIGVPVYCSCCLKQKYNWDFIITLPFLWVSSEYIKSWLFTGFPWENLGCSQYLSLPIIQIADITGIYGISFLVVLVNCTLFSFLQSFSMKKRIPYREIIIVIILLCITLLYGGRRLRAFSEHSDSVLQIALVQPNIAQNVKWNRSFLDETIKIYTDMTLSCAAEKPDLIVWPEAATPFYFQSEPVYQQTIKNLVGQTEASLLFGSPAWVEYKEKKLFFNSAFLIAPDKKIKGRYDKIHLVPYGEYVPLKKFFPFINKIVVDIGNFSSGKKVKNLHLSPYPFGVLICYEIIFPELVKKFTAKGAQFLVNITNDAWFGETGAPYQHLSMAVFRAVENRRFIVRAANTGISAFIDCRGKIIKQTKLFTRTALTGNIELNSNMTFYVRFGDIFAKGCLCLSILFMAAYGFKQTAFRKKR